jgi:transcriptional regulator with XRE-family HTH domain
LEAFVFYCTFIRIERGLSQRKLATITGIGQPTISDIEHGRTNPNDRERKALAKALGVSIDDLLKPVDAKPLGDGAEFRDAAKELR